MDVAESARLMALREYGLLDSPPGDELQAVVRIAAAAVQVPFGAVNLIDDQLQCQLTTVGFPAAQTPRADSMCALHFRSGQTFWTPDASEHADYACNPWVDGTLAKVRFYATVPLVTPGGHALGSFCVFDTQTRHIGAAELELLEDAAITLMALFERHRETRLAGELAAQAERQSVALAEALRETEVRRAFTDAVLETVDVGIVAADAAGHLTLFNRAARDGHGIDADPGLSPDQHAKHYSLFAADGVTPLAPAEVPLARALQLGSVRDVEFVVAPQDRPGIRLVASGRALTSGDGELLGAVVVQRDVTEERAHAATLATQTARETERLRTTIAVQRELTAAATDRTRLLDLLTERVRDIFGNCRDVIVGLLDGETLRAGAVSPGLRDLLGIEVGTAGTSLSGEAVRTGTTLRSGNAAIDPRSDKAVCEAADIVSMMAAPLFSGDRVIGAVTLIAGVPDAFDENDEQQLTLLADAFSGALRQADDTARRTALLDRTTRALTALEASETRFRLSFDQSPLGMALTGLHGGDSGSFLQVNPALTVITGYPIEVLTGMNLRDLQHPDDVPSTQEALEALAAGRLQQMTFDKRYRHADGHYIWVRVHVAVAHDDTGTPAYLVTQIEDIDGDRTAARQLAERAQLLDLTQDAVIVRSLDGRVRFWNAAAEKIYGWPAHIAAGHDVDRLLDTTWTDGNTRAIVDAALIEHGSWTGELEHRRADGQRVVLLSRKALQRDTDGHPIGVLSINTDITARRTAELALTASEQRFRSQFLHSTVGQMIRALDDTIEDVNPAFAAMLGRTPEQLIGSPAKDVFDPSRSDERQQALAAMFAGETDSVSREGHLVKADGTLLDVHLNMSAVRDDHGKPQRFVGIFQDITDRKSAETQRDTAMADLATKNNQLEDANQLKQDLIGMLGHEINNPLSTILGLSDQAVTAWSSLSGNDQHKIITIIDRNARRLNGVVHEVLALVSVDAGKLTAYPEPTPVASRVAAALAANRETIPVDCDERISALVQPGHLDQIMTNLLSNATKYGGGATALTIQTDDQEVLISVEDRGPGVPQSFRDHLFERFTRSDNTAGRISGTGLGLYIVRELARANNGDVTYRPNPEGGSIFTLHLPLPQL